MIQRSVLTEIKRLSKHFSTIIILGPRQVGKTTLVKEVLKISKKENIYIDLEKTSDFQIMKKEAENFLLSHIKNYVVIDEIQRMPSLFPLLRHTIDEDKKPNRYLITGSSSPFLLKGASESLAGRVVYLYMHPIAINELPDKINMTKHWFRGGFPEALTIRTNALWYDWTESFVTTYIEKDLPFLFEIKFTTITMRKLWSMLAHWHGNILNNEKLGASLDVTGTTLKKYLDFLEGSFIITRLPPFHQNIGKRLVKSPKVYINDSGLLHYLLRIKNEKDLQFHPSVGASWEGYVISQIMYCKKTNLDLYFYRTHTGAECDLVIVSGHIVVACIEIKYSKAPNLSKGFFQSIVDMKCKNNFVICMIDTEFKNKNGIIVLGLKMFIDKYLNKLK